jgi:hypothetical protein
VTDGVVSRDLHEVVVEDPETRPGSGTTDAIDAGAVPIEVTFKPLASQSASEDRIKQNDVPSPRATASKLRPIRRSVLVTFLHHARSAIGLWGIDSEDFVRAQSNPVPDHVLFVVGVNVLDMWCVILVGTSRSEKGNQCKRRLSVCQE